MGAQIRQLPGVLAADISFASGILLIEYEAARDPRARAVMIVRAAGHGVEALGLGAERLTEPTWWQRHSGTVAVVACGAMLAIASVLGALKLLDVSVYAYAIAIVAGGTVTWRRALASLRAGSLDINVLMTIAVAGAALIGEWSEGATVVFLFALGGMLESRSLARTRRSIRELMAFAPAVARLVRGSAEVTVPAADVGIGDTVVVRPGDRTPLDGVVSRGASAFDESPVTGESTPADKGVGDTLYAGSLNTTGRIEMTVTARAVDSTLARIVHLVEEAHASKAPSQRFIDRFSARYTPAVLVLAVAVAIVPPLLGELGAPWPGLSGWEDWLYRALVLLVVSCPCALVISTPVALVSAITRASRNGVLIKGGAFLEAAASVSVVAFDKTGTITCGEPRLTDVVALVDLTAEESLLLAAALERSSAHPVARAVVAAAPVSDASQRVEGLSETPGRGVRAEVDGVPVVLGGLALLADEGLIDDSARGAIDRLEAEGKTALGMAVDGKMSAVFGVADTVRPVVGQVVDRLREDGIGSIVMLTGDNDRAAAAIAARAGIADVRSRLLPADKTRIVRELQDSHGPVLMVGDGINDAPALAASDIGVAMGVAGSDTALETADVALMNDDLTQIPLLLDLGRRTMSIIRQNVAASIGIKAAVLVAAVAGHATLWMAVFADTGVSLLVIANGLRLLGTPGRRGG